MAGVLGIDAAWTESEPSGVALIEGSAGAWRCVAVAPSFDSFLSLAEGMQVDWAVKSKGAIPDASRLVAAAETLLGGRELTVVTVDMPLSTTPITGRRAADLTSLWRRSLTTFPIQQTSPSGKVPQERYAIYNKPRQVG